MPSILTITNVPIGSFDNSSKVYDYSKNDRILKNIHKNEYEVFYSGQNEGGLDYQLTNAIEKKEIFKVYYRRKKNIPYKYLGETNNVDIIQYRKCPIGVDTNPNERLQIHLIINNPTNNLVPTNDFTGSGKFKKDVLVHAGLRNTNGDIIIPHNKNLCIGFYSYNLPLNVQRN